MLETNCPPITKFTTDFGDFPMTGRNLEIDGIPMGLGPRRTALDKVLLDAAIEAGAEFREGYAVPRATPPTTAASPGSTASGRRS